MTDIDTKREEIREGMEEIISPYMIRGLYSGWDKAILQYLHSQDIRFADGEALIEED